MRLVRFTLSPHARVAQSQWKPNEFQPFLQLLSKLIT